MYAYPSLPFSPSGFDPNTPLKSGWPALLYACDCGSDTMTELLLSYGANPNTQKGSDHFDKIHVTPQRAINHQ